EMTVIEGDKYIVPAKLAADIGGGDLHDIVADAAPLRTVARLELIETDNLDTAGDEVFERLAIGLAERAQKGGRLADLVMLDLARRRIGLHIAHPPPLIVEIRADRHGVFGPNTRPLSVPRHHHLHPSQRRCDPFRYDRRPECINR